MTHLQRSRPAVVEMPAGTMADQAALTCGPWLAGLRELRRTLFIIPLTWWRARRRPRRSRSGLASRAPVLRLGASVHYGQRSGDDRLVFGRGGRLGYAGRIIPSHFHDPAEIAEVVADLHELLPGASRLPIEWTWGGPVERTHHHWPWVGSRASRATSTTARATRGTVSARPSSSAAHWRRWPWGWTTSMPRRRWSANRLRISRPSPPVRWGAGGARRHQSLRRPGRQGPRA